MGTWLRALLLFVVFNKVELYRQVKNSTCLELAEPSNQQFRLPCNNTSLYHCLLDQSYTREYEICKMWKWIPEGKCAHLNTYKFNIDAMSCSSSAKYVCPKALYQSREATKYAACYVKATSRQVKNTTCLELAKPPNEENRLTCNNSTKYHCLLDGNKTNEYEICRVWKWVPKGNCAYFNKYSGGNIDIRKCTPSSQFVCAEKEYSSRNNTLYPACYVKKSTTSITTEITSSFGVTSKVTSDNMNSTAYPISDTTEKQSGIAGMPIAIVFGVFTLFLLFAVISFFYHKRQSGKQNKMNRRSTDDVGFQAHQQEKAVGSTGENENNGVLQSQNSENDSDEDGGPQEQQQLINNVNNSGRHSQHLVNDSSEENGPPEHQPLIGNNCSTSETAKTNGDEFTEPTSDERTVSEEVNSTVRESELKVGKTVTE